MKSLPLLFLLCSRLASQGQPVFTDRPYLQDYSIKYDNPQPNIRLMKVACDRNGVIRVLSSEGLLRPQHGIFLYPGELRPDKTYRPLLDRKIMVLTLYDRQFVYTDTQAVLSNAWAGKLYIRHTLPNPTLTAGGPGFSFLLANGHSIQYLKDSLLLWHTTTEDSILDIRWDQHAHSFWVLGQHTVSRFSPATNQYRLIYHGDDLTCIEPVDSGILVGTHNGYFLLDENSGLPSGEPMRHLPCTDITVIRRIDGKTWFGSAHGAFVMHSPQPGRQPLRPGTQPLRPGRDQATHFDYFASRRWLPSDSVADIAAGPDGQVLILTDRGLAVLHFDPMMLHDKALFFEKQVRDRHIRLGFNAMLAGMPNGDLSTGSLEDSDNDGLWTSMYLAAEAFRYAATHDPEALQNCRESLDAMERLYTINSLRGFPSRSFERRGYAAADTQVWKHAADPQWDWKSTTSSDEAIGHVFAFGVIADVVDDTALTHKAIRLLDGLMSHIVEHHLYLVDWNGQPTTWGRWNPAYVNARPPMVGDRKINSSNIIAMLETAWHFTGKRIYRDKAFELMNQYGYLDNLIRPMSAIGSAPPDADALSRRLSESWNHSDDEMYFLGYWGLYRYAFNDTLRKKFKAAILDHWQAERPEKEGAWDLFTAITGTPQFDLDAAIWYLQRSPLDMIDWSITNSHRQDITPIAPNFRRQTIAQVLPPDELPVSRHNTNRFQLDGNGNGHSEYSAGDIWLLPYWLGRYLHVITAPDTSHATTPSPAPVAADPAPTPTLPTSKHPFVVIAHRADHEHAPENTIAAIRDAIRCGADYVELDLRTTRDGHLVLNHDASIDRITGSHGTIAGLTLAELQHYIVRNPGTTPQHDHIPEFRDALRACKDKINIYLDFKEADVAETWRQIRAAHMEHQVVVYLNKPGQYEQWRAIAPQVPLMNSLPDDHATRPQIDSFLQVENIAVLDNVYDTLQQRYVRQLGITLWLDAQSEHESPAIWSALLRQNIQGIQTDHPEELIAWLRHHDSADQMPATQPAAATNDPAPTAATNPTPGIYNVKNFGATGDGITLDSKAINKAILAATDSGGGTVFIPAGNYVCGSIRLKSNIRLHLDQGATLIAAEVNAQNDYDEEEPGSQTNYQDKGHSHWHNSLIWGEGLHDISITGSGRIWGKGLYRSSVDSRQSANKAIALLNCRNVTLKDFSILHGGWFAILATGTDNLTVDNLRMDTNRDGIDVDACHNVRIANCLINSPLDDGICLKSSYALDSLRSTDNVTITNCQVSGYDEGSLLDGTYRRTPATSGRYPTGRIKLGTESNGGFRNITISNCVFEYCRGLALETVDGARLEDVAIDNITMRDVKEPIFLRLGARLRGPAGTQPGTLRRIRINNLVAYNTLAADACTISGIPGHAIEDVSLSNIDIWYQGGGLDTLHNSIPENETKYPEPGMFGPSPVYGLYVRHAKNISLTDACFHFDQPDYRPPLAFDDVDELYLRHVDAQRLPHVRSMLLQNTTHLTIADPHKTH